MRVCETRKEKKWTLADLSQRSGIAVSTLSGIEKGKTDPQVSTVLKLAKVLEVNVDWLVGVGANPHGPIGDLANLFGLDEIAVENLQKDFQNDELGRSYTHPNEWMLGVFRYFPEAGLHKENAIISEIIWKMELLNHGQPILRKLGLSPQAVSVYKQYRGLDKNGVERQDCVPLAYHSSSEYVNELDHYVVNVILSNWKLVELISNYLRAVDVSPLDFSIVKANELTISVEDQIIDWLRELRKEFINTSPLAFPTYSTEDKKRIDHYWRSFGWDEVKQMDKLANDEIEKEFDSEDRKLSAILDEDLRPEEMLDKMESLSARDQKKE